MENLNQIEYEITPKTKLNLGVKELWQYRELFYFFTWRDIKVKYKQTTLGFLWAVLQPALMMILLSLFFGRALKIPSDDIPYPVFVLSGLLLWNVFSSGITNAGNSMVTNANIIKKIYFPRLIIPISAVLVSLFDFLMAVVVFIVILIYYQTPIDLTSAIIFIPTGILLSVFATLGLGTFLASLNIKYRDFRYVIPFFVQALLFVTPVIYPLSVISNTILKIILACNPMYAAIELFRYPLVQKPLQTELIYISILSSLVFFFIGLLYFRKTESYFADLA